MNDVTDLSGTIVPKSDQLNSEQLLTGPMTVTVTDVKRGKTDEQPVTIHYQGENGRPYKPCKTCRKQIILAWGKDGASWIGKSMTLFCDPAVQFGGSAVGGIRISHMSHIDPRGLSVNLTATRGRKANHTIAYLHVVTIEEVLQAIARATNKAGMEAAKKLAEQLNQPDDIAQAQQAYRAKVNELRGQAAQPTEARVPNDGPTFAQVLDMINKSTTTEALEMAAGFIEGVPAGQQQELRDAVEAKKKAVTE